jgi:hypothetical protein
MKRKSGSFPAEFSLNGFQKLIVEHKKRCKEEAENDRLEAMQEKRDEIMSRVNDAARGAQGGGCQPLYLHYRIWMPRPSMN